MFKPNTLFYSDGYKPGHKAMLAPGTTKLYGTWIPRSLKYAPKDVKKIVSMGQQLTWRWLHDEFEENFFQLSLGGRKKADKQSLLFCKTKALQFAKDMSLYLGMEYDGKHFEELWDLGYLPMRVKALPEGIETLPNITHMTFVNTVDGFAWLTLYLETIVSALSWKTSTSATLALQYRRNLVKWVIKNDPDRAFLIPYLCHDFSSRGLDPFSMLASGLGHASSFRGSDSLIVIPGARYFYGEPENEVCINSVNASEHSVTCTGIFYYEDLLKSGKLQGSIKEYYSFDVPCEGDFENPDYKAIAEWLNLRDWLKKFPKGILSVVSDTFDLWKLITFILPRLKTEIMSRDGKLVIRPDSGDPVDIICGISAKYEDLSKYFPEGEVLSEYFEDSLLEEVREDTPHGECGVTEYENIYIVRGKLYKAKIHNISWNRHDKQFYFIDMWEKAKITIEELEWNPSDKGVIELLWDIFGGTVNEQGYKVLDSHIGAIYGDSINLERQVQIYERLDAKGFACTNIVLGVGLTKWPHYTEMYN